MKDYKEILEEVLLSHGLVGISKSLKNVFYDAMCKYADQFIFEKEPENIELLEVGECD